MRSYPMRRPGVPACVTLEAGALEAGALEAGTLGVGTLGVGTLGSAAGRVGPQALVPGACCGAADPGVRRMAKRFDWTAARAAKRAAKREARAASPRAGTGATCEIRSYPMQPPGALAPAPLAPAAAEPARSGPCPLAIDPDPCNRGVEPGVGPMGQRRGRAAARVAKRAAKRAAKRLARGASTSAGTGSTCEMRSYPMQPPADLAPAPPVSASLVPPTAKAGTAVPLVSRRATVVVSMSGPFNSTGTAA
jgi:hypothetical protein